jgi:hypothetical protein
VFLALFVSISIAAAFVTAVLDPTPESVVEDVRMSTDNAQPRGARGLYLWLRVLGYTTRSLRDPLASLSSSHDVLFLLDPEGEPTPSDLDTLFRWVADGGVLVVSPGYRGALLGSLEVRVDFVDDETEADEVVGDRVVSDEGEPWRYREMAADDRGMFAYPVGEIAFLGSRRVADPANEHSILFARDGQGVIAEVFEGDGAILVLAEGDVLTNRGIAKADNVELVASLLEDWAPPGATIAFDDFDHGLRLAGSLGAFLARRRPGLFAVALLGAGWLALLRYGRALTARPEPLRNLVCHSANPSE